MKLPTKQQSDLISFSYFFLMFLRKSFSSKDLIVNLNRQTEEEKKKKHKMAVRHLRKRSAFLFSKLKKCF